MNYGVQNSNSRKPTNPAMNEANTINQADAPLWTERREFQFKGQLVCELITSQLRWLTKFTHLEQAFWWELFYISDLVSPISIGRPWSSECRSSPHPRHLSPECSRGWSPDSFPRTPVSPVNCIVGSCCGCFGFDCWLRHTCSILTVHFLSNSHRWSLGVRKNITNLRISLSLDLKLFWIQSIT